MRCPQCGLDSSPQAQFCSRCGARLLAPKPAAVREYRLALVRPSMLRCAHSLLVGAIVIGFGGYVLEAHHEQWRAGFILMGIGVLIVIAAILTYRSISWSVTSDRLIEQRGILASHRRELELSDIRSIEVNRRVFQRLLGIGDVTIASAASADFLIRLIDVSRPDAVAETVRMARLKRLA